MENIQENMEMQEYWNKLQRERLSEYPPEVYRNYVLCDPTDSIREENA